MTKDMKDALEMRYHKMWIQRDTLFRAWFINYVAIFAVWLFSMTGAFHWTIAKMVPALANPPMAADMYMLWLLGFWKIAVAAFLLVPAFAIWWQMSVMKKWIK
jgi:hypothetical protein